MFKNTKITTKIVFIITIITTVSLFTISYIGFSVAREYIIATRLTALENIALLKVNLIEAFFHERMGNIKTAQNYYNVKTNLPIVTQFADDRTNPAYISAKKMLDGQLKAFQSVYGYIDVMLINPEGKIVYASNKVHEKYDLDTIFQSNTEGTAFKEGKKGIYFSDIYREEIEKVSLEMFAMAPINDFDGKFIGVIAIEINMEPIYKFIQDTTGMGNTGETLIGKDIGGAALFLNRLRHDKESALKKKAIFGAKDAYPIQEATRGRSGSGLSVDYRGKEVIAAWHYIPSMNWGLVAKIDVSEAFAMITRLKAIISLFACGILAISLTVGYFTARTITIPVRKLTDIAYMIRKGNLKLRVDIKSGDEIGVLANTFNEMLDNIKTSQEELKQHRDHFKELVDKRTSELSTINKELINEIAERKRAVDAMNTLVMTTIENEGQKFFEQTVSSLYDWLGVDCVILGKLIDENNETALAMKQDGEFVDNFSYELQGSPCGDVSKKGFCFYPEGVIDLFPDDKALVEWKIEGYVGISLKDKSGNCIGTICALSRSRLELPSGAENVFKIISARASVELERMHSEKRVSSLAHILEESLNEVFIFEADTLKFLQVNKRARGKLGYSNEELMKITPIDITPEFTRESFEKKIEPLRSGKKDRIIFESVHQRKDGSLYDVEIHLQLSTFETAHAIVALILDITDRKKADNILRDDYDELENKVAERTNANALLEEKNREHERFNKVFVEREFRIKELRDRVKELEEKIGD